jgi:signal transduction histidine kinase
VDLAGIQRGVSGRLASAGRGLAIASLMPAGLALLAFLAVIVASLGLSVMWLIISGGHHELQQLGLFLVTLGAGLACLRFLLVPALVAVRRLANRIRHRAGQWCGTPIPEPYLAPPAAGKVSYSDRVMWLLRDPATWRDLVFLVVNACVGWLLAGAAALLIGIGTFAFIIPGITRYYPTPAYPGNTEQAVVLAGVALVAAGLLVAPWLLEGYGLLASSMLGPAGRAELELRVKHLAETRSEAIDTGAAEIRRIERDLHDGAQARLVAMGMALDAAGHLMQDNPDAARALLIEARDNSAKALAELRDLVRGIHPPVLADRGLAEAIRAVALDNPLRTHLSSDLDDRSRPPAPVESAAYFAVTELLANVGKHAGATQVWVDIRYADGMLRIGVTDDGHGGADPARGSGLAGIERRLGAFDGVLAVSSPPGGPTSVTMEIPCVLSSPKTSSS